jgi:hypothetical protein
MSIGDYISIALIILGALLAFTKDVYTINTTQKPKIEYLFAVAAVIMGILGGSLTCNSIRKSNIEKELSDSSARSSQLRVDSIQKNYDSLVKHEIRLLGGLSSAPIFTILRSSPTRFQFMLADTSQYTMKDITVTLRDEIALEKFKSKFVCSSKDSNICRTEYTNYLIYGSNNYDQNISIPYLTYNNYNVLKVIDVKENQKVLKYRIDLSWTVGSLTYYLNLKRVNGDWVISKKKYDRITGITIDE